MITVIRDGVLKEINGKELVVGDVYIIKPGMMIPADSVIVQCTEYEEAKKEDHDNTQMYLK